MAEKDNTWNLRVSLHDFPKDTLKEIKTLSDKHNGSREWLANVYHKDGKYVIGSPVFGDYSGVSMKPDEQAVKDRLATGVKECVEDGFEKGACKNMVKDQSGKKGVMFGSKPHKSFGATQEDLVGTIHLHPIRRFESDHNKEIRSQFSGTDIGSEAAKGIRDGKRHKMFLTFPQMDKGRRHNILKFMEFPGKQCFDILKKSNPHLTDEQIYSITPDGKGIELVDWYAYQEESKRRGLIQELDIEKSTGSEAYKAMGNTYAGMAIAGVLGVMIIVFLLNRRAKKKAQGR